MTKNKINRLELLAPAKDLASGKLAIDAGADAVYIAGSKFGARQAAGNPVADIGALIEYAHLFRVKVYVALNTILRDDELSEAKKLIDDIYEAGADGLIIQDLGLLELDLPPIKLIASTQTDNYEFERIKFLEKSGFERIILARELSLEQIKDTHDQTKVELEAFVHGALCVSFSGRCYLSQALAGRSANRGECLQACRLPYSLVDSTGKVLIKDQYLLSLKDLNLSGQLEDLIDAGITSFKIEGRLKDEDYVVNITSLYRQKLDEIIARHPELARASAGLTTTAFTPDPEKTFNRSFTTHFLDGRQKDIISPRTPKSLGKLLGRVKEAGHNYFILEKGAPSLRPGDGLCFFTAAGELSGTQICRLENARVYPGAMAGIRAGAEIYRNLDTGFLKSLEEHPPVRRLPITWELKAQGQDWILMATDEEGNQGGAKINGPLPPATNAAKAEENWRAQLQKLGETPFIVATCELDWTAPVFAPLSVINEARRQAIEALLESRAAAYVRETYKLSKNKEVYPAKKLTYEANVYNSKAEAFYRRAGVETIEPAFEGAPSVPGRRVMTCKHCLKYYLGQCSKTKAGKQAKLSEPLSLVNNHGQKLELKFDCGRCQMEIYY
jgi:putative protease